MRWLTLHLEIVTPCFIAGADNNPMDATALRDEGLRTPSLIGQWRYWLRAASAGRAWKETEDRLFGSQHNGGNQGALWVRPGGSEAPLEIVNRGGSFASPESFREDQMPNAINPLEYLLGQGLFSFRDKLTRPGLKNGAIVPVDVAIRGSNTAEEWAAFRKALWLWQTFGGLGSRCRRGWGGIAVRKLENDDAIPEPERGTWKEWFPDLSEQVWSPAARLLILERVKEMGGAKADSDAPYSHIGSAQVIVSNACTSWEHALAKLGIAMLRVRSNAPRRSRPSGDLRVKDHDRVSDLLHKNTPMTQAPHRAAFGLPHNYFFKKSEKKCSFEGDKNAKLGRRASPVLMHVLHYGMDFIPVVLWLRSKLVETPIHSDASGPLPPPGWDAVREFLQEFTSPGSTGGNVEETLPTKSTLPPPSPKKLVPINKGQQDRKGKLEKRAGRWIVVFVEQNKEGQITNPADIPQGTVEGSFGLFFIEEANKQFIRARFDKLV